MKKHIKHLILILCLVATSAQATEYLHNTCGIVQFRAKTNDGISDVSSSGNIDTIEYLDVGRYRIVLSESIPSYEIYQVVFMAIPGFTAGVTFQNESYFEIGVKDFRGDWADCGELTTASFNRLTAPE